MKLDGTPSKKVAKYTSGHDKSTKTWGVGRPFAHMQKLYPKDPFVCPKDPGLTLQSYCGDGIGTIKPTKIREGYGSSGIQIRVLKHAVCSYQQI